MGDNTDIELDTQLTIYEIKQGEALVFIQVDFAAERLLGSWTGLTRDGLLKENTGDQKKKKRKTEQIGFQQQLKQRYRDLVVRHSLEQRERGSQPLDHIFITCTEQFIGIVFESVSLETSEQLAARRYYCTEPVFEFGKILLLQLIEYWKDLCHDRGFQFDLPLPEIEKRLKNVVILAFHQEVKISDDLVAWMVPSGVDFGSANLVISRPESPAPLFYHLTSASVNPGRFPLLFDKKLFLKSPIVSIGKLTDEDSNQTLEHIESLLRIVQRAVETAKSYKAELILIPCYHHTAFIYEVLEVLRCFLQENRQTNSLYATTACFRVEDPIPQTGGTGTGPELPSYLRYLPGFLRSDCPLLDGSWNSLKPISSAAFLEHFRNSMQRQGSNAPVNIVFGSSPTLQHGSCVEILRALTSFSNQPTDVAIQIIQLYPGTQQELPFPLNNQRIQFHALPMDVTLNARLVHAALQHNTTQTQLARTTVKGSLRQQPSFLSVDLTPVTGARSTSSSWATNVATLLRQSFKAIQGIRIIHANRLYAFVDEVSPGRKESVEALVEIEKGKGAHLIVETKDRQLRQMIRERLVSWDRTLRR